MLVFALSTGNKLGLGLIALLWIVVSLTVAMVIPRSRPGFPGKNLPAFLAACVLFFGAMLFAVFYFGKESKASELGVEGTNPPAAPARTNTGVGPGFNNPGSPKGGAANGPILKAGKQAWDKASCGGCHTLAAAGGTGTVGPNLDQLKPDEPTVARQVTNGGGAMPAFKGILSPAQITAVATYVAQVAGTKS